MTAAATFTAMPDAMASGSAIPALPVRRRSAVHLIALLLVWLAMATGGLVFSEPAATDFLLIALVVALPAVGLAPFQAGHLTLLGFWLVIAAGGALACAPALMVEDAAKHTFITLYLSVAAAVLAAFVSLRPETHGRLIMNGYLIAAIVTSIAGIIGYFGIIGQLQELLTNYGRARGTFKDPNVFGAFLVPAAVYAVHVWANRRSVFSPLPLLAVGLLALGTLLSFSRGAWAALALAMLIYGLLAFMTAKTNRRRLKLFVLAFFAVLVMVAAIAAAMQLEAVSRLLSERASLSQDYDIGPEGRFGGQKKAFDLVLENPLGIGAKNFSGIHHHEEAHNVYLSMFMNAGWIGGFAYLFAVLATIAIGLRACFASLPGQGLLLVAFSSFTATALEGAIIDTDHWRHFFVLMGLVWGFSLARAPQRPELSAGQRTTDYSASSRSTSGRPRRPMRGWSQQVA